ncbi:MAG TPA: AAA family ATPase [Phycicoccus sp.]|mgnify:CR=1 FL=1|nr:AAA family ATPase [Phycicoccus sp.]HQH07243.1 AAA family ATPase [Phycicoccus sp.]HQK32447.1 AAA family ATPase [Phycicoccus sp.]HQY95486.1 AAA family ATPase [Phycicoccus sp.]HRA44147.1 AAA family ATPase [Phycicoccus sp.]
MSTTSRPRHDLSDVVAAEVAREQSHVDTVYAELAKANARALSVETDGLARGRTDRTGDVRDEEMTGLFERDALVYAAGRRRAAIEKQYEGLVFGRLDLGVVADPDPADDSGWADDSTNAMGDRPIAGQPTAYVAPSVEEVRYIGRLGVRDDDYEPLVIDWRAPAAAAFYRATPVDPMGVVRRRVLRCKGPIVIGVEDDLMVPEAPEDMVVVGDGALIAALTRSRGRQMRDIVATIQRHQDEAIRASSRGITEISGGPGTGKTVVALHRAAYLLYSERRRFEHGGILVVGPSAAYTAYIERVLPSLGEDSVALRALGDLVDGLTATRIDSPDVAAVKGGLRIRRLLARAADRTPAGAPDALRCFVNGHAVRLDRPVLERLRAQVLRSHQHNAATDAAREALAQAAWASVRSGERDEFLDAFDSSRDVDEFMRAWWPQLDPREVLLRLTDTDDVSRLAGGVLTHDEAARLALSYVDALELGTWSVSDAALIDDLSARLGPVQEQPVEEVGFYDIEEMDDLSAYGVQDVRIGVEGRGRALEGSAVITPTDARARLLLGRIDRPSTYAHVLVDEAQDLSPMQWRMLGRRGRTASWTVVGDAAQASWGDLAEAAAARRDAYAGQAVQSFHMDTNYRNAREIFDYAREVILPVVPDADIPKAVRETGVEPSDFVMREGSIEQYVEMALAALLDEVDGSIAIIPPTRWHERLMDFDGAADGRVQVVDPLSTKGLEWDATIVLDPEGIIEESPGGARVLYVVLTRAAHRMTVLRSGRYAS